MEAFFIYLVQSAVCVFLYESFYRLLLRGESFHCLNRMVLLGSLFCALLLPLADVSLGISEHPTVFSESLSELVALQESVVTERLRNAALSVPGVLSVVNIEITEIDQETRTLHGKIEIETQYGYGTSYL